jgi:DNA-binding response OmpR family regulator
MKLAESGITQTMKWWEVVADKPRHKAAPIAQVLSSSRATILPVNDFSAGSSKSEGRILVLEPDESLVSSVLSALHEAAPTAVLEVARNLEEAHRIVLSERPDLFVLDMDAAHDLGQDFLIDLRTSHPEARAIVLTAVHLAWQREQAAGIGAIHFLEKPFPHSDFVDLVHALLRPGVEGEKFQGTLSDLHLSDIIQLKCMSGATSALEITGPVGEKARVYFDNGQVCHAVSPGCEGVKAFNEIVSWKSGRISEVAGAKTPPCTIDRDWQFLLMDALRRIDETTARRERRKMVCPSKQHRVLVIDDSLMMLNFVEKILSEANYDVVTAATAQEGLLATSEQNPDLILLDYLLPDLRGDEVSSRLRENESTARIPVVFVSSFAADLEQTQSKSANVLGVLNKPFTSDLLLEAVEQHLPRIAPEEHVATEDPFEVATSSELTNVIGPEVEPAPPIASLPLRNDTALASAQQYQPAHNGFADPNSLAQPATDGGVGSVGFASVTNIYFSGDTDFVSFASALRVIAEKELTGTLRSSWTKKDVELYARDGKVVLVTTRDTDLYWSEEPTLANVDPELLARARATQSQNGCPFFIALAAEGLIQRDPALQLARHYGQKLFAHLWAASPVRFAFEQTSDLPDFTRDVSSENDMEDWMLRTLRFVQVENVSDKTNYDVSWIPTYTRYGLKRVEKLQLSVKEAQFGSQFNGARSIAQIAHELQLDAKFARSTLFRFVELEIVECWPPGAKSGQS